MNTINNQDTINEDRLALRKMILKINSRGNNELCLEGLKEALGLIVEYLNPIEPCKDFNTYSHNHQLIMLIEEVCYNLITESLLDEGTISLESIYECCLQGERHRITKIYLDDELQKNHPALPISEIMTLCNSVTSRIAETIISVNHHRQLFIYLYLARQKLLVTNN